MVIGVISSSVLSSVLCLEILTLVPYSVAVFLQIQVHADDFRD